MINTWCKTLAAVFFCGATLLTVCQVQAATPQMLLDEYELTAVGDALSEAAAKSLLGEYGKTLDGGKLRAAAAAVAMGALRPQDVVAEDLPRLLNDAHRTLGHPFFVGQVGELALLKHLGDPWDHQALLAAQEFLGVLAQALGDGHITGYDLRPKGVYEGFTPGRTFIYSHSSQQHLQQLVTVMAAHGLQANVYLTPKVSAFLYRSDWGPADDRVQTLPGDIQVVNGRESATLFEFRSAQDRAQFHEIVGRYAKRDAKDEAGLIADAWWQPFYYTDQSFADFPTISLVVLSSQQFEATLTATEENTDKVVNALSSSGFPLRVDRVWVNPAFYRFLQGDYR